jgi:hypothetical protein
MIKPGNNGQMKQNQNDVLGSVHISTSNILSYSLVTAAAMLAFFFAFQAALLSYFSNLYGLLAPFSTKIYTYQIPAGKISLTILCVLMIFFTVWSLLMVHMTVHYIQQIIKAGSSLEGRIGNLEIGVFSAIYKTGVFRSSSQLPFWTSVVCWTISFLWIVIGALVWMPRS